MGRDYDNFNALIRKQYEIYNSLSMNKTFETMYTNLNHGKLIACLQAYYYSCISFKLHIKIENTHIFCVKVYFMKRCSTNVYFEVLRRYIFYIR